MTVVGMNGLDLDMPHYFRVQQHIYHDVHRQSGLELPY